MNIVVIYANRKWFFDMDYYVHLVQAILIKFQQKF